MHQKEEILEGIFFILQMNVPAGNKQIDRNTYFKDLKLSAITFAKFIRELELHFKIEIPSSIINYFKNIDQLSSYILTQLNKSYE